MKYVIAVHSYSYGTAQALRDYLKPNHEVLFIEHPLFGSIPAHIFSMWDTFWKVIKTGKQYETFFGANPLNAFVGLILRRLGRVKKVIYFFLDYTPTRPPIYWWLDYFCIRHCDKMWNSSNPLHDIHAINHLRRGVHPKYLAKQIAIPEGTIELEPSIPFLNIAWVGHFKKGMGLEMLIDIFNEISKFIPCWHLIIMGKGELKEHLQSLAKTNRIVFINTDIPEGYDYLRLCSFGVAPYEPGTISEYTDPGKVKNYLSCGLPVVLTKVPLIWKEIESNKAGIAINYNREELQLAIMRLMLDKELRDKFKHNAYELSKQYRWDKIFEEGLK